MELQGCNLVNLVPPLSADDLALLHRELAQLGLVIDAVLRFRREHAFEASGIINRGVTHG